MNYIEWVLLRGTELWREREKALRERLSRPAAKSIGAAEKNGDAADAGEEAAPVQSGRAESAADGETGSAAARAMQKLRGAPDAPSSAREEAEGRAAPVGMTAHAAAPLWEESATHGGGSAAVWLRQELGKNMTAAAGIAAAKERDAFTLSQEREMRETEAFSQSLERDARRYDGGFLFY